MSNPQTDPQPNRERFVTVAEACQLLGVSERTARRYAGQVPDADRQTPDRGPARYRLATLRRIAGKPDALADAGQVAATDAGPVPDEKEAMPDSDRQLIEQLRGEVAYLREALTRSQENEKAALSELAEARRERIIEGVATGRVILPPVEAADVPSEAPNGTPHATDSHGSAFTGESTRATDQKRPIWQFWKR